MKWKSKKIEVIPKHSAKREALFNRFEQICTKGIVVIMILRFKRKCVSSYKCSHASHSSV